MYTISKPLRKRLQKEIPFRTQTALALGVTGEQVKYLADKNSDNLTKYAAIEVFLNAGYTLEEIFEKPKHTA